MAAPQRGGSADRPCIAGEDEPREGPAGIPDPARDTAGGPEFGTTSIRAYRLAFGVALADVVAQVRARYAAEGRPLPRFSETLLSAYESAQKRPGPEYMHYLCAVYQADPQDLGYQGPCFCGTKHGSQHPSRHGDQHPSQPGDQHGTQHSTQ